MNKKIAIFLISAVVLTGIGSFTFSANAATGDVVLCVAKNGDVHVVGVNGYKAKDCNSKYDKLITINTSGGAVGPQGPVGPIGLQGPVGPQGPAGEVGPQGPAGPQGLQGPKGDTGEQGPAGQDGAPGATGETGPQGPVGPQGPQGPAGADGTSVKIIGSLSSSADLPTSCSAGDAYLINGDLWICDGSTPWVNVGNIQGPKGDTGSQGLEGPMGPVGPQGPAGQDGAPGEKGEQGEPGLKGNTGAQGPEGAQGPVGPAGAVGPAGPEGPQGPKGEQGEQGPKGDTGAQGPSGVTTETDPIFNTWLNGFVDANTIYTAGTGLILSSGNEFSISGTYKSATAGNADTVTSGVYTNGSYTDPAWLSSLDWSKIANKPVLFSGSYLDLTNKPTLFSGSYDDLTGKPAVVSAFTNDAGYLTSATLAEADPIFTGWNKSTGISITKSQVSDFGTYVVSEIDPIFGGSEAKLFVSGDKAKLNSALQSETDPTIDLAKLKTLTSNDFHNLGGIDADTTYTAGAGLKLTGTEFAFDTSYKVPTAINADTVTNGLYSTGAYADPSWLTKLAWSKIDGAPAFLTGYTETDPVFNLSAAKGITGTQITNWEGEAGLRSSADATLISNLSAEITARTIGVAAVQTNLDNETASRIATDGGLAAADTAEEVARIAGDATKEGTIAAGATSQYWRGDKSWQTLNTDAVVEATNKYFTNGLARAAISGTAPVNYDSGTGVISLGTIGDSQISDLSWSKITDEPAFITLTDLPIDDDSAYATIINLTAETTARTAADGVLTTGLASEVTNRTNADIVLGSADVVLQGNIDAEAIARTTADTALQTNINGKENTIGAGASTDYWTGNKTWAALNTGAVAETTNLYFTDARAKTAIDAAYPNLDTNSTNDFSGAYGDLTGKPTLFSGVYADLTGKPTLFDGAYASLTGAPTNLSAFTNGPGYLTSATLAAAETDPQVGTLTANKWCVSNSGGTVIDCNQNAPVSGSLITTGTPVTSANDAPNGTTVTATAACPSGKILLGGGGQVTTTSATPGKVAMQSSYPSGTSWTVVGVVTHDSGNGTPVTSLGSGRNMTATAYVICSN